MVELQWEQLILAMIELQREQQWKPFDDNCEQIVVENQCNVHAAVSSAYENLWFSCVNKSGQSKPLSLKDSC